MLLVSTRKIDTHLNWCWAMIIVFVIMSVIIIIMISTGFFLEFKKTADSFETLFFPKDHSSHINLENEEWNIRSNLFSFHHICKGGGSDRVESSVLIIDKTKTKGKASMFFDDNKWNIVIGDIHIVISNNAKKPNIMKKEIGYTISKLRGQINGVNFKDVKLTHTWR